MDIPLADDLLVLDLTFLEFGQIVAPDHYLLPCLSPTKLSKIREKRYLADLDLSEGFSSSSVSKTSKISINNRLHFKGSLKIFNFTSFFSQFSGFYMCSPKQPQEFSNIVFFKGVIKHHNVSIYLLMQFFFRKLLLLCGRKSCRL